MSIARTYMNKNIIELEEIFDNNYSDIFYLKKLNQELEFRKTKKSKVLKIKVENQLQELNTASSENRKATETYSSDFSIVSPPLIQSAFLEELDEAASMNEVGPPIIPPQLPPKPDISNKSTQVLSAWTALEVLSPSSFKKTDDLVPGDPKRIANIQNKALPWENGLETSRPKHRLYYQIILGTIQIEPAMNDLVKLYTDSRDERPQGSGEAILATIMVDKKGVIVESNPVSISSFGWGFPIALEGSLSSLGDWIVEGKKLEDELTKRATVVDEHNEPRPINGSDIQKLYSWLIAKLNITGSYVKPPSFVIRTYQFFSNPDAPEALLLNSFFLSDLALARNLFDDGIAPANLAKYIDHVKSKNRTSLMTEGKATLSESLAPVNFSRGSWPTKGRHSLVLRQQSAVNLVSRDLKKEGLIAINGPPGTGKTTLLRDVIANILTDRARKMTSYTDPEDAFSTSGQKIKKGGAFIHLYKVDKKLRGDEIVVASSNNKAVENVSAELPALDAIAADMPNLRYFKTASDNVLKRESWGMIAAVLGNASNRYNFSQDFWWHDEFGLQKYLQHICGAQPLVDEVTEAGIVQRPPRIIQKENPPNNHEEAILNWKQAKKRFLSVDKKTKIKLAELQNAYELNEEIQSSNHQLHSLNKQLPMVEEEAIQAHKIAIEARAHYQHTSVILRQKEIELRNHYSLQPNWLNRLFKTNKFKTWQSAHHELQSSIFSSHTEVQQYEQHALQSSIAASELKSNHHRLHKDLEDLKNKIAEFKVEYQKLSENLEVIFIDTKFFELDRIQQELSSPWLDNETVRLRHELFESAIAVHKAFIDASAKYVRHNLNALMSNFGTRSLGSSQRDALIPHLWSTLFLLVPVVSTTFASMSRMFGRLGPEALGWMLIDEAGQALPQAAVGALLRSKKTVLVGDPIQIEPVVILPDQLTNTICEQFGVDPLIYNAPLASAQTLADSATDYYGTFETTYGSREVGVPLLVHRRCSDPMFRISNSVAYENLMVQAKSNVSSSPIIDCLGSSKWIHIEGSSHDKWCQSEGEAVLNLLQQMKQYRCKPDVYIITPFVIVQNNTKKLVQTSGLLNGWVEKPNQWADEHIGTVHTVQGREAEAVIFILGAPNSNQTGARNWAGSSPNILNVAVTRAKEVIYVVGNAKLWKEAGSFQTLYKYLEKT